MSDIIRPSWPLGLRFIGSDKRVFEVTQVFMGDTDQPFIYSVELENGRMIISQPGEHPQTKVGFVDIARNEKLITESVEKLDQFVKTGHLKIIRNGF